MQNPEGGGTPGLLRVNDNVVNPQSEVKLFKKCEECFIVNTWKICTLLKRQEF